MIRGKGITNVLVVVTRYFGGTLLGTGGLVRSYTAASAEALSHSVIITRIFGFRVDIHSDYAGLGRIQYLIAQRGLYVQDTVYTDRVVISVLVPEEEERAFSKEVQEGTNGQAVMEKKGDCWFAQTENGIQIWNE